MSLLSAFVDLRKSLREKKVRDLHTLSHKDVEEKRALPTLDIDDVDRFKASQGRNRDNLSVASFSVNQHPITPRRATHTQPVAIKENPKNIHLKAG
jgi:hypothetical protein